MVAHGFDTPQPPIAEDDFEAPAGAERINRLLAQELGEEMAASLARARAMEERWERARLPHEGLRERKKRLTRQQISDVATTLFIVRGFEHVTVAQIAEVVGVSEKTVYNYFPTKESLVFDMADEASTNMAHALRDRDAGESPTRVMLRILADDARRLEELPDEIHMLAPLFAEMVSSTPSLRAAWLELQDRLVKIATVELARRADLDPRDPEPTTAARALVGLTEIAFQSRIRHIEDGLRGSQLSEAVTEDLERAARLLDTGLWSFNLLTQGARTRAQVKDAALTAEETREQVISALKQARAAWREIKARTNEQAKTQAKSAREEAKRAAKEKVAAAREEAKRAAKAQVMNVREEAKRAALTQMTNSYEAFRQAMIERHEAIRARERSTQTPPDAD